MLLKTIWGERTLPYELKQVHFDSMAALKHFPHVR